MKNIIFYTFGCRTNQAETASLKNAFLAKNFIISEKPEQANFAVINTCTVTEKCEKDLKKLLNKLIRIKTDIKIALLGCLSELKKEQLLNLPNVKWVINNSEKFKIVEELEAQENPLEKNELLRRRGNPCGWSNKNAPPAGENGTLPPSSSTPLIIPYSEEEPSRTRVQIKIQEGCDEFCTYCIVPYLRGPLKSRNPQEIIQAINKLSTKEIVLTGTNIGKYKFNDLNFNQLLKKILTETIIPRIRISSIEPPSINDELIETFQNARITRHLHIPLQSGNNKILELMGRKYRIEDYKLLINKLNKKIPGIAIGTDIIVGFPDETQEDFEKTYNFLNTLPLTYLHVFPYSSRPLTKSSSLTPKNSHKEIKDRVKKLRALSQIKQNLLYESQKNKYLPVLFEEQKNGFWLGLTDNYLRIKIKSDDNLKNQIREILIK